jgi:hypothetical protein
VHIAIGYALAKWVVLALPAISLLTAAILTASGFEASGVDPVPALFLAVLFLPIQLAALAIGIVVRRTRARWR